MLVEDNDVLLRYLEISLREQQGIEVIGSATTAHAALEMTAELKPDLVLMDIGLPDINGLDTTRLMKNRFAVKVLILTGSDDEKTLTDAFASGADGYCLKQPILDTNELKGAIESVASGAGWLDKGIARKVLDMLRDQQSNGGSSPGPNPGAGIS